MKRKWLDGGTTMTMSLSHLLLFTWLFQLLFLLVPAESFAPPVDIISSSRAIAKVCGAKGALVATSKSSLKAQNEVSVDICVIGAGISGLTAAITAAEKKVQQSSSAGDTSQSQSPPSILVLESDSAVGGRVRSDHTEDGFILDRGFAVFIEEYPQSKKLLDYDALGLEQFLPGARVKLAGRDELACVSDPLRRPRDLFRVIASPVGSPLDKLRLSPLFYLVMTKSIEELFEMEETDTMTCLKDKYNFSEEFISSFFAPFLEGIYLATLEKQSSRMFHFVMKMFTIGSTSLPRGGMQAAADQLGDKANELGVEIQFGSRALSIQQPEGKSDSGQAFLVEVNSKEWGNQKVLAKSVVVATDVHVSESLLKGMDGVEQSAEPPTKLPQRSVGCIYYSFRSPAPLADPILILNGEGGRQRNTKDFPINNVCFPSMVQDTYAPNGYELCSVCVLEKALSEHGGDHASLDAAVRKQLSTWFPDCAGDIMDESKWVQKGVYVINNAQPVHFGNDGCANVHGGRGCTSFQGMALPSGVFVCGDHMATSTFNGALESGVNAGSAVERYLSEL